MTIHDEGTSAVDAFCALNWGGAKLVRGPKAGKNARIEPDCTITYRDEGVCVGVEIKKASSATAQVRALDYRTVVVWVEEKGWWVIPPHEVLELATSYAGQHCSNSLECMNPGKPNSKWERWKTEASRVPSAVLEAYRAGERSPMKALATRLKLQIDSLASEQKELVRRASGNEKRGSLKGALAKALAVVVLIGGGIYFGRPT